MHSGDRYYGSYRAYRVMPYYHHRYIVCPWYSTFYYPSYYGWSDFYSYAPGFSWGLSYNWDYDSTIYFRYGYGGGVRFGECDWIYSWYPYGGHQRVSYQTSVPASYTRFVASYDSYDL